MTLRSKKGSGLFWLAVLLVVIGIIGVVYFFQSNIDSNDSGISQKTSLKQPEENSQIKSEDATIGTVIKTDDSEFGSILFDGRGQAVYIWELEESTTAECYGNCAEAWPPVLTDGEPVASGSVNTELLGTTKRTDGTTQVTYNGHPLYYYAHEEAGEVKCHNVSTHGGLWWVIKPSGVRAE